MKYLCLNSVSTFQTSQLLSLVVGFLKLPILSRLPQNLNGLSEIAEVFTGVCVLDGPCLLRTRILFACFVFVWDLLLYISKLEGD